MAPGGHRLVALGGARSRPLRIMAFIRPGCGVQLMSLSAVGMAVIPLVNRDVGGAIFLLGSSAIPFAGAAWP
jgi:hypothetical protein